jgi:hypothetical protein
MWATALWIVEWEEAKLASFSEFSVYRDEGRYGAFLFTQKENP